MNAPIRPSLAQRVSDELLPRVKQPGQYIGGEVNQLVRPGDWQAAKTRVVVAFPDAYTVGMSHLGCQILYWLANHTPGVCAERLFTPQIDAETEMRARNIPLFTWDTRQPVAEADLLLISLQYELCYTNILTLLDLAGIPFHAADRDDHHPLVIAGGPQADNPEPMADFLDLVVIGDGEDALADILATYRELRDNSVPRREMIPNLARRFPWIYAPSLYRVDYNPDNTIAAMTPTLDGLPTTIQRCQTPDFENAPFPTEPIVPWVEVVHDRISIEIMRGCPQVCRFCHAGYTKRPLRLRSVDRILDIAEASYRATGHHEIGLLSLSTADYPHLAELTDRIHARFADRRVNVSLPSLRVDETLRYIPQMANTTRKGGLTLAVEAANDDLRAAIRKKVTDGNLLEGVLAAYRAGWKRVKLYFMVGFPGETRADWDGIFDLAYAVSQQRRRLNLPPAAVTASVGWLVPKPFTPMQWAPQPTRDYFLDAYRHLRDRTRRQRSAVQVKTPRIEVSLLEGVFARGDRRLAPTILDAWKRGARFDGWTDRFDYDRWLAAFEHTGVDPAFYAHRRREPDEILPWDFIGLHMSRDYLKRSACQMRDRVATRATELPVIPGS